MIRCGYDCGKVVAMSIFRRKAENAVGDTVADLAQNGERWRELNVPGRKAHETVMLRKNKLSVECCGRKVTAKTEMYVCRDGLRIATKAGEPVAAEYVLHIETIGGRRVPILSEVVFEYDGRGEIILREYARDCDKDLIPDGYISDFAEKNMT